MLFRSGLPMHVSADRDAQLRVPGQQRSHRRALMAGASAVAAGLLLVAAVASFRGQGPIEDKSAAPQIAQTAIPNGKYYLMKMIRRQVAMKQRQAKEKAEHLSPLKVHIMRSYKQVLADKMAHPAGSKSKLKALAEAKLKKAKQRLLEKTAHMRASGKPVEMLQEDGAEPIELQQQAPPNYQFTPLQTVPQYQAAQSMPAPGYPAAPQMQMGEEPPMGGAPPQYAGGPPQQPMYQQQPMEQEPPQQEPPMQQQPQALAPVAATGAAPAPAGAIDPMAPSFVVPPTPGGSYASPCRAQFSVQALGLHQHDSITISLLSAPPGSSISTPITSNPGSTIFTWQPPPQQLQAGQQTGQACFQARDRTGLTRSKCIQVTVSGGAGCAQQPPAPAQQQQQQPQPQPQQIGRASCRERV